MANLRVNRPELRFKTALKSGKPIQKINKKYESMTPDEYVKWVTRESGLVPSNQP